MNDFTDGVLEKTKEFAKSVGQIDSLLHCINRLESREVNNPKRIVNVYVDIDSPHSFYFVEKDKDKDTFIGNGGIIYHGKHDMFGAGGFSNHVTMNPTEGWQIHT